MKAPRPALCEATACNFPRDAGAANGDTAQNARLAQVVVIQLLVVVVVVVVEEGRQVALQFPAFPTTKKQNDR